MEQHNIDITITKTGEVEVHVKGVKGKGCLEYGKLFTELVGKVKDQKFTSEYYEPESKVRIQLKQEQGIGNG